MLMLGYFLALIVGLSLGALGTGGAVLTIPVLVYVWHFQGKQAVASGFVIVVLVGLLTAWQHYRKGNINFRFLRSFAPMTMLGTHVGVSFSTHIPGSLQLMMLAFIMVTSAILMLCGHHEPASSEGHLHHEEEKPIQPACLMLLGSAVGVVVGIVGVGGGFIILPILVHFSKVPMRQAVGTTLSVALLNSLVGGLSCLRHTAIPWDLVLSFAAVAICGGALGVYINAKIPIELLRKALATLMIVIASAIVYENVMLLTNRHLPLLSYLF